MKELINTRRKFLKNASLTAVGVPAAGFILGETLFPKKADAETIAFTQAQLATWTAGINTPLAAIAKTGQVAVSNLNAIQTQMQSLLSAMQANNFDSAFMAAAAVSNPAGVGWYSALSGAQSQAYSAEASAVAPSSPPYTQARLAAEIQFVRILSPGPNPQWEPGSSTEQQSYLNSTVANFTTYGFTPYFAEVISNFTSMTQAISEGGTPCQWANLINGLLAAAAFILALGCLPDEPVFFVICPVLTIIAALLAVIAIALLILCQV